MKISLIQSDITKIKADAIVNAANSSLFGGGGVDGAIHRASGYKLYEECLSIRKTKFPNGLPVGEAVATKHYNLNSAKIIIHTVGPRYKIDNIELLKNCYINSLKIGEENHCETIAFPAISTGAYGLPIEISAKIVKEVFKNYKSTNIKEIILVLHNQSHLDIYKKYFLY